MADNVYEMVSMGTEVLQVIVKEKVPKGYEFMKTRKRPYNGVPMNMFFFFSVEKKNSNSSHAYCRIKDCSCREHCFSGNYDRIIKHLRTAHGIVEQECSVQTQVSGISHSERTALSAQAAIDRANDCLVTYMCKSNTSARALDLPEWRGFVDACIRIGMASRRREGYPLVNAKNFPALLREKSDKYVAAVKRNLEKAQGICIVYDGWEDRSSKLKVVGATVHYVVDGKLHVDSLSVTDLSGGGSADSYAQVLSNLLHGLLPPARHHLLGARAMSDGARAMLKLQGQIPGIAAGNHIVCVAHYLHNVVVRSVRAVASFDQIVDGVRRTNSMFKQNRVLKKIMADVSDGRTALASVRDVDTRWGSLLAAIENFVDLRTLRYKAASRFDGKKEVSDPLAPADVKTKRLRAFLQDSDVFAALEASVPLMKRLFDIQLIAQREEAASLGTVHAEIFVFLVMISRTEANEDLPGVVRAFATTLRRQIEARLFSTVSSARTAHIPNNDEFPYVNLFMRQALQSVDEEQEQDGEEEEVIDELSDEDGLDDAQVAVAVDAADDLGSGDDGEEGGSSSTPRKRAGRRRADPRKKRSLPQSKAFLLVPTDLHHSLEYHLQDQDLASVGTYELPPGVYTADEKKKMGAPQKLVDRAALHAVALFLLPCIHGARLYIPQAGPIWERFSRNPAVAQFIPRVSEYLAKHLDDIDDDVVVPPPITRPIVDEHDPAFEIYSAPTDQPRKRQTRGHGELRSFTDTGREIDAVSLVKVDALEYWNTTGRRWPGLQRLALSIYSAPASSASVERLFSTVGLHFSNRRQNMRSETLQGRSLLARAK